VKVGAIPYFGDAYMADTRHLTLEEHGAYHLLLLIAWRSPNCALPDDDKRLAQMLGITGKKWAALKPIIIAFWTRTENGWEQKRLTKERRWVEEKSSKNRDAAEQRWSDKPLKNKEAKRANACANGQPIGHANGHAPPPPPPLGSNEPIASSNEDVSAEPTPKPLSKQEVIDAWQGRMVAAGFAPIARMTGDRERKLRARLKDSTLEEWQRAMDAMERSAFCRGENDRGWKADFDFLLQPKSFTKLLEGAYDH
jgi:uncharacterized protein YdaU (DUF1376 family)